MSETELLRNKLKICRSIMRQHNIGHLYPDVSKEYEDNINKAIASMSPNDSRALYSAAAVMRDQHFKKNLIIKELIDLLIANNIELPESVYNPDVKNPYEAI